MKTISFEPINLIKERNPILWDFMNSDLGEVSETVAKAHEISLGCANNILDLLLKRSILNSITFKELFGDFTSNHQLYRSWLINFRVSIHEIKLFEAARNNNIRTVQELDKACINLLKQINRSRRLNKYHIRHTLICSPAFMDYCPIEASDLNEQCMNTLDYKLLSEYRRLRKSGLSHTQITTPKINQSLFPLDAKRIVNKIRPGMGKLFDHQTGKRLFRQKKFKQLLRGYIHLGRKIPEFSNHGLSEFVSWFKQCFVENIQFDFPEDTKSFVSAGFSEVLLEIENEFNIKIVNRFGKKVEAMSIDNAIDKVLQDNNGMLISKSDLSPRALGQLMGGIGDITVRKRYRDTFSNIEKIILNHNKVVVVKAIENLKENGNLVTPNGISTFIGGTSHSRIKTIIDKANIEI